MDVKAGIQMEAGNHKGSKWDSHCVRLRQLRV
jgi:hypothetical protein